VHHFLRYQSLWAVALGQSAAREGKGEEVLKKNWVQESLDISEQPDRQKPSLLVALLNFTQGPVQWALGGEKVGGGERGRGLLPFNTKQLDEKRTTKES